ncbi:MAG: aspartate-semialdehyde dehydrogenase [Candidatus Kapabacteria bacterium]|jgi:aspartate-semialdehyde dehydrogenase|nr:aspartate-semialdehyde dehydrogenase [Candidatus Kapabacteria bacterium]
MKRYNVAIVGAGGLVGRAMLKVLEEQNFPVARLGLFASSRSAGTELSFRGESYKIEELMPEVFEDFDIALFSAGGSVSKEFAPIAVEKGCIVIDNSSAWRMDPEVPLIVPEVNPHHLQSHKGIIANPNCSTIQLVVALKPLSDNFGLKRVVCSTYQSISGAGNKGVEKLRNEISGTGTDAQPIAFNLLFHQFEPSGFTVEESKMINETRKIFGNESLSLAFTCVRVPTLGGHCESVNVELESSYEIEEIKRLYANTVGVVLMDDTSRDSYPTPQITQDTDPVYIGRIRRDDSAENALYLWVAADNLRKGAATNAVQIAQLLIKEN